MLALTQVFARRSIVSHTRIGMRTGVTIGLMADPAEGAFDRRQQGASRSGCCDRRDAADMAAKLQAASDERVAAGTRE